MKMLLSECLAEVSCPHWINHNDSSKSLKPYHLAARWIPIAVGPFININASLYAGAARLNNSQLPYVVFILCFGDKLKQWDHSPGTGKEDLLNFDRISAACPGLIDALKAFDGDETLLKYFAAHVSSYLRHVYVLKCCSALGCCK